MTDDKPKIVFLDHTTEQEPQPFPMFITFGHPRTDKQIQSTARRWEADAVFGFYKLKLSVLDEQKMSSYLDSEISADQLIQRFLSMT